MAIPHAESFRTQPTVRPGSRQSPVSVRPTVGIQPIRVLLVDRDEEQWQQIRHLLSYTGLEFELDWVDRHIDGMWALRSGRYDVCLVDGALKEQDGIDLSLIAGSRTRVLVMGADEPVSGARPQGLHREGLDGRRLVQALFGALGSGGVACRALAG